ncbi:MAG: Holliday junction branch migration protein RuvA [Actinomycetia bacterium]|nr:Holliday junction branch migration protein RuvA [Actinomycetes bacterium]
MFAFIRGRLVCRDAASAVIDVNGIGFRLGMSTLALAALGAEGSETTIHTSLIVRDDSLQLYGFIDPCEQELFERLLGVSGIGPKVALSALSAFSAASLELLIVEEDVKRLSGIPGIGKKTAQRIILELRGTLSGQQGSPVGGTSAGQGAGPAAQVTEALLGMGFTSREIGLAMQGYDGGATDAAELLRFALKRLGG